MLSEQVFKGGLRGRLGDKLSSCCGARCVGRGGGVKCLLSRVQGPRAATWKSATRSRDGKSRLLPEDFSRGRAICHFTGVAELCCFLLR